MVTFGNKKCNTACCSVAIVIYMCLTTSISASSLDFKMDGFEELTKNLDSIMEMFGGIDGTGCSYKCPDGEVLIPNPDYVRTSNGCGSFGVEIHLDDLPQQKECCNQHDICYDTCGQNKTVCDVDFKMCTSNVCTSVASSEKGSKQKEALAACQGLADMMFQTTTLLGCQPFKKAQQNACKCVPGEDEVLNGFKEEL